MRREAPEPWASAMRDRGMLHGQRPSFAQLAAAARQFTAAGTLTTQAVIDIVTGKTQEPADEIVRALASALALPVEEVARWIGRPLDVGAPYAPPNGADRLTRKQREALDHIIRVMTDREEVGDDERSAPTKQELEQAEAAGRNDLLDAIQMAVIGSDLRPPAHYPHPQLHAAYAQGWQAVKGEDVRARVDAGAAAIADVRPDFTFPPASGPTVEMDELARLRALQESADGESVEHIKQQAADKDDQGEG